MTAELNNEIRKYILQKSQIEAPSLQKRFSISYSECNTILEKLTKEGVLEFVSGITYKVNRKKSDSPNIDVYVPKNEQEAMFIKALWACIKNGSASASYIQRRCATGYVMASKAIDWMERNKFISPFNGPMPRDILIEKDEFIKKFGNPDSDESEDKDDSGEEDFNSLMERLSCMDDDGDDEEDIDKAAQERREYLEKRRQELIERMKREINEDEANDDDEEDEPTGADLRQVLTDCVMDGLSEAEEGQYVLNLDGEPAFEFEFVCDGSELYISDGGETLKNTQLTKRKIRNILKEYPHIVLGENGKISVTLDSPDSTFMSLLNLYAAVDAIKKSEERKKVSGDKAKSIKRLCNVLHLVADQKTSENEQEDEAKNELSLDTLYSKGFDMQAVIASIPDMDEKIKQVEKEGTFRPHEKSLREGAYAFENICMDVMESIVKLNPKWERRDAIHEAAKELVAVQDGKQRQLVIDIHRRVYFEFTIATDEEYEALRRSVWED